MQNIRYHIINTGAVVIFSFVTAITISQFVRLKITPMYNISGEKNIVAAQKAVKKSYDEYKPILESTFFKLASETNTTKNPAALAPNVGNLEDFQLLGTISGPASIARALIKKKGEKEPEIFKLWSEVYGYKLVGIDNSKIFLKRDKIVNTIDMYPKDEKIQQSITPIIKKGIATKSSQALSRSEIQQKLLNNIDNALEGLRAGPNRVDGKIDGYKLFRVSENNFLYKLGARSGDIAKRINGHPIDSTEKLLGLWQSVQGESKITVDIERGGKLQTFEFNVTD